MVKIAISSQTPDGLDAITDMHFGRCPFFTIVEVDGNKIRNVEVIENAAVGAFGGAGIQAAQSIANQGVKAVIAGNYGPNASSALAALESKIFSGPAGVTVKEAVEQYISGRLTKITGATGPAHMGMGRGMRRGRGICVGTAPSPVSESGNYCPYCGAEVVPTARFCSQCGKAL